MMKRKIVWRSLVGAGVAVLVVGGAVAAHAVLSGSPSHFESNDGNMIVDTTGQNDWASVTGSAAYTHLIDSTTSTDDSFTPGTKQDSTCPTTTGHGNPPKDDFSDIASYTDTNTSTQDTYLYGATIRAAANGNASENIELKQGSTLCPGSTLTARTPGDKMIAIDYLSGGVSVQFTVLTWVITGACYVGSDAPPCWGATVLPLTSASAEGLASQAAITAGNNSINGKPLSAGQFAEFGVDLAGAGIIPSGTCDAFPQTVWESRSAGSSFVSSTKDISIENKTISNCGTIIIRKTTINGDDTFNYSTTGGLTPSTFSLSNGGMQKYDGTVEPGGYTVTEGAVPTGWRLFNLACTASGGASYTLDQPNSTVNITMVSGGLVDCTYTNKNKLSPTIATTLSASTINLGDSLHDSATLSGATTDAGGTVTYSAYQNGSGCTGTDLFAGNANATVTVSNGSVPDSPSVTPSAFGNYNFQAVYSGDVNNFGATSACLTEGLLVKANPTIATKINGVDGPWSISVGASANDTATLSSATADAGGSVTYTVYNNSACTTGSRSGGTVTVTNGVVPASNSLAFNSAGTFYWQAVYTGDGKNNGATSTCTSETLTVTPKQPTASTAQNVIPNDSFTLAGGFNPVGSITFNLYSPSDMTCSGTPALTQTVTVSGNGTYVTTNTTFIASTEGTWRWASTYTSSNNNNLSVSSTCGTERFTIANS